MNVNTNTNMNMNSDMNMNMMADMMSQMMSGFNMMSQMMGMKPGDWICAGCGDHQFAKNMECRKCGAPKSDSVGEGTGCFGKGCAGFGGKGKVKKKPGDWYCPQCSDLQFAKNIQCRKCGTPNPDPEGSKTAMEAGIAFGFGGVMEKPGDWWCPGCNDLQFAKNAMCRKCGTPNPDPEGSLLAAGASKGPKASGKSMTAGISGGTKGFGKAMFSGGKNSQIKKPGDWYCSNCGDLQFARNVACKQCGTPNFMSMMMMGMTDGTDGNAGDNMGNNMGSVGGCGSDWYDQGVGDSGGTDEDYMWWTQGAPGRSSPY